MSRLAPYRCCETDVSAPDVVEAAVSNDATLNLTCERSFRLLTEIAIRTRKWVAEIGSSVAAILHTIVDKCMLIINIVCIKTVQKYPWPCYRFAYEKRST